MKSTEILNYSTGFAIFLAIKIFLNSILFPHAFHIIFPYPFRILSPYPFHSAFYPHIRSAFYPHIRSVPFRRCVPFRIGIRIRSASVSAKFSINIHAVYMTNRPTPSLCEILPVLVILPCKYVGRSYSCGMEELMLKLGLHVRFFSRAGNATGQISSHCRRN